MLDLLRKTALIGIGLAYMTKDKVEELAKKIAEENKLSEEEGKKVTEDLLKRSDEAKENLKGQVEKFAKNAVEKLDIPSRADLQKLEEQIKKLEDLQQKTG